MEERRTEAFIANSLCLSPIALCLSAFVFSVFSVPPW
ncbi:MAG: hypothetical protein BIFFINMI_02241 [Phycisphaerae bacterium]|nr:hypothetical protein [Phycisphaerae bacterium]